jgi:tripartite-type tricarboxylate transporter receptor subunit TctC
MASGPVPGAATAVPDAAADFPARPVRWVVGFAPGASNDVIARTIGARLAETWGQQFIVDNRTGAAGMIGGDIVARATPDGYTVLLSTSGPSVNGPLLSRKPLYRIEDFTQVAVVAYSPLIIVVQPSFAAKGPRELVEHLKANPGKVNWGSSGVNGSLHIGLAVFEAATGVRVTHVPYKGAAVGLIDVAGGQIQGMHTTAASAEAAIRGQRVRVLAVAGPKRIPSLPDVPTLAEAGIRDGDSLVWFGMAAPLRTPAAVVRKLNDGINRALAVPDVQRRLVDLGMEIVGGPVAEAGRFVRAEADRIRKLIAAGVLKPE